MKLLFSITVLVLELAYNTANRVDGFGNKLLNLSGSLLDFLGFNRISMYCFKKMRDSLENSNSLSSYKSYQLAHFHEERIRHSLNANTPPKDNLFLCSLKAKATRRNKLNSAGYYSVSWTHLGLKLEGYVFNPSVNKVNIVLDGVVLRKVPINKILFGYGFFRFNIKRNALAKLPLVSCLELRNEAGQPLLFYNKDSICLSVPHGDGTIFNIKKTKYIDKKGNVIPEDREVDTLHVQYLDIYREVKKIMLEKFGRSVFLMYGTLLGHHRDGQLIKGDDDFDVGYWSDCTDADSVKRETKQLVVDLVLHGFNCSFNRKGRLFRIALPESPPGVHLDIRPVWYEGGHVWAHRQAKLALEKKDFVPVKEESLRGMAVFVPNNAEAFLESYYGKGWKVPDPSYSNELIPRDIKVNLNKTNISPNEFREMCEEISRRSGDYSKPGRFISVGLSHLYGPDGNYLD